MAGHTVSHCVMCKERGSCRRANRSVAIQDHLDYFLHGCPAATTGIPVGPAPATPAPSAAIRSGSQLGPKRKANSTGANVKSEMTEATGIGSASSILPDGRPRIPFPDLRTETTSHPRWPSSRAAAPPSRYRARARRLTPEQETTIRALAGTRSLRSLAVDVGVSHETIRAVVRQERSATR